MPGIPFIRPGGGGSKGSISVAAYSDSGFTNPITSADSGATIYMRAENVSGITPVEYLFAFIDASGACTNIYNGVNDNTSWTINASLGSGRLFCFGTEDASSTEDWVGQSKDFEVSGFVGVLDAYPNNNVWSGSQMSLRFGFTNPLVRYRRASDNDAGDFSRDNSVTPVRITDDSILSGGVPSSNDGDILSNFVSGTDAFAPTIYDQTTNGNNATQSTASKQSKVVDAGSLILGNSRACFEFDGSDDELDLWALGTVPPLQYQTLGTAITYIDWVYPTQLNSGGAFWFPTQTLIELTSGAVNGNVPLSVGFEGNKLKVGVADNTISSFNAFTSTSTFSLGVWYKIAVTVNFNTVKIYVNGSLDSTHTITSATGDRSMGANNASGRYCGRGDFRCFKGRTIAPILKAEVLTDAEITDIHNNYYV